MEEDTSSNVRNENLTTYLTDIKSIIKECYISKDGMNKFLKRQNLRKLTHKEP